MKFRMLTAVFFTMIISLGFTWFQPKQEEKKSSPSGTTVQTSSPQETLRTPEIPQVEPSKSVKVTPLQAETFESGADLPAAAVSQPNFSEAANAVRQVQGLQTVQSYKSPAVGISSVGASPINLPIAQQDISPLKDLEVVKIQKQINEIIETNEKFKSLQQSQTDQIRQITEQAQMHRRMLQDLEEKNKSPQQDLKKDDVDEILRQEKMRIIENETEKNKLLLDHLATQQGTAGTNS